VCVCIYICCQLKLDIGGLGGVRSVHMLFNATNQYQSGSSLDHNHM
jgi:hypothetical protein